MKVRVFMPAYNEERHITQVVRDARELGFPTLVVDDASADATVERARAAGRATPDGGPAAAGGGLTESLPA
ncbi:MAG: glycosyltransferase [Planctomycetota bacterium]